MSFRPLTAAVVILLGLSSTAFAQLTIRAVGAETLGWRNGRTGVVGGGLTVEPHDIVQVFADAAFEFGHTYPADTIRRPSYATSVGAPSQVIIVSTPDDPHGPVQIVATYFGGVRLITPPDRPVRVFANIGMGFARYKSSERSLLTDVTGYYTAHETEWGFGGGFSKAFHERWVVDGEYRLCAPLATDYGQGFQRVQVSIGRTF